MKMLKKTVAILLAMVMILSSLPVTAFAAEISSRSEEASSEASTDGGFQYTVLPDNTAEICGYTGRDGGDGEFLYIPETVGDLPVTALAQEAFAGNDILRGVFVPASITSIGNSAFYHCRQLEVVALADSPAFGITAFEGCTALRELLLPMGADMMTLSALLENDLSGQRVNMSQYADTEMIKAAFDAYNIDQPAAQADVAADAEAETKETETGDTETAAGVSAEGTCGDGLVWTLSDDGKLTISGTGQMADYSSGAAPWYEYREQITSLELSEGLTSIGQYAFYNCSKVTGTLVIPDNVTSIKSSAFSSMSAVTAITFGKSVAAIDDAFSGMSGVSEITFTGSTPPAVAANSSLLASDSPLMRLSSLKTVYLPLETYTAYVEALTGCLPYDARVTAHDATGEFLINDGVLAAYFGDGGQVTIPSGVTRIGTFAFQGCEDVTAVNIPSSVTAIDSYAFSFSGVTELTLPEGLTSIGDCAFIGCGIASITLPEGLVSIGDAAFAACQKLTSLTLPDKVARIGDYTFYGCAALESVTFPSALQEIGEAAFLYSGLTSLTLPEGLTSIGQQAFYMCQNLSGSLIIPDSVTSIGAVAFAACSNLTKLELGSGLTRIEDYTFYNCNNLSGDLVIPDGVTYIGEKAFEDCYYFTALKLPQSLTTLGSSAFHGCARVAGELVIPDKIADIPEGAFSEMYSVTSITFGKNVASIYTRDASSGILAMDNALYDMTQVTEVTFTGNTVPTATSSKSIFAFLSSLKTVRVPEAAYDAYVSAFRDQLPSNAKIIVLEGTQFKIDDGVLTQYYGIGGDVEIPEGVTAIAEGVFQKNEDLTSLTLPEGLTSIGANAFQGCTMLKSVVLPSTLRTIDDYAFENCGLDNVSLPEGLESIGNNAFQNCHSLRGTLTIPDSVISIGSYAFSACSGLTGRLTIPDNVTAIGSHAFSFCSGLTGLTLGNGLTCIEANTFYQCSGLTDLLLPDSITEIGASAFAECNSLTGTLVIPDSVTVIRSSAFDACSGLEGLSLGAGLTDIGSYAFRNCSGLKGELVIPDNVTSIGNFAFESCSGLTSLVLGTGLTSITYGAFKSCSGLTGKLLLPESVTEIDESAFAGCSGLTGDLIIPDSVTKIYGYAFNGCSGFDGTLTLSQNLTVIGNYAFANCSNITGEISVPDGITSLGDSVFGGMSSVTSIIFGKNIRSLSSTSYKGSLYGMSSVKTVTFTGTVPPSGGALSDLQALEKIYVPAGYYNTYAKSLNGHTSGARILVADAEDFQIEDGVLTAYFGNDVEVAIPEGVTAIGEYAFQNVTTMEKVIIPDGVTKIGAYAFSGCSSLTGKLVLPDSVTDIHRFAFRWTKLTSLVFGRGTSSIYSDAFANMSNLAEITFTGLTAPYIDYLSGIHKLSSLKTVYVPGASYDAYVAKLASYLPSGAVIVADITSSSVNGLAVTRCGSKSVTLTWDAFDNNDVIGYRIERNGAFIGETDGCTFADTGLLSGNTYKYTVYGYTADGRVTQRAEISATPQLPAVSAIEADGDQGKISLISGIVHVSVANCDSLRFDGNVAAGELYYIDNGQRYLIGQCTVDETLSDASTTVYTVNWDAAQLPSGSYEVVFCLTDLDGAAVEEYATLVVDNRRPAQIVGVIAISDVETIHLTWAISSEVLTETYRIYRKSDNGDFQQLAQVEGRNTLSYIDSDVQTGPVYYYYVVGVNDLGVESEPSLIVGATLSPDEEAPRVTKLTPANGSYLTGTVAIGFTAEDNVSVTRGELYYSLDKGTTWTLLGEGKSAQFNVKLLTADLPDGTIQIKSIAYDAAGNVSDPLVNTYAIDNTGPEQVQGLTWEATSVTATLRWQDVADQDISFYRVEQFSDGSVYTRIVDVNSTLGANLYNLTPDTEYTYRVVGYDIHGNRGTPSEMVTVKTESDTTAPVVTRIRPTSGRYIDSIDVTITATDEYNVAAITLQTSQDAVTWTDVHKETYTNVSKSRTMAYQLPLEGYEEGSLYIRGVAVDTAGNVSDTGRTSPFVQHIVDRTAPNAPENVTATGCNGYNEIAWAQGEETDLGTYSVYRSVSEDGTYLLLKSGIQAINYIDRTAEAGRTYYYKVNVNDTAGNVSAFSAIVSAASIPDTEAPQIVSIYPQDGSTIGSGYRTVSVLTSDNRALDYVLLEYSRDGENFTQLLKSTGLKDARCTINAELPLNQCNHGDTVYLRATACDTAGNVSDAVTVQYTVDMTAPTVSSAAAEYADDSIKVTWTGNGESDLAGYRIYRRLAESTNYRLIAQRQAVDGQSAYFCNDYDLALTPAKYVYKIEAVDIYGNTSAIETSVVATPDRSLPTADLSCEVTQEVGVEYVFDATGSRDNSAIVSWLIDFGDGTSSTSNKAIHVYQTEGTYTVTLTVTDDSGNQSSCQKTVAVKERKLIGAAKIRIVNENGAPVSGAPVYFDLGEDTQVIKTTDGSGYVSFTSEVGRHTVGCVIPDNQWLPVKKDIIVTAGNETTISMTLIHHVMVEGRFTVTRMTFEEITAAGIDVSVPENQYIVRVNIKLVYGEELVETSAIYNPKKGEPIKIPILDLDGELRALIPKPIPTPGPIGGGESSGHWLFADWVSAPYEFSEEPSIAILDIPIGASTLKEFFNVNLHIINNASQEFSMKDNVVTLNVPDGLSIVDTYKTQSSPTATIAEIKGQTQETITWILRGDKVGEYYVSADYSGILAQFDEPISAHFAASDPIEVYGMTQLKMRVDVAEELDHGTLYYNVCLTNEGGVPVYRPKISSDDTLIETELFDVHGVAISDRISADAKMVNRLELASSITGDLDVLQPGYRLTYHYMSIDQTLYAKAMQQLSDKVCENQNSYGLEAEIVVKPLSYFKSNLNASINAEEKADRLMTDNKDALSYLLGNEHFIYWNMYAAVGPLESSLPQRENQKLWDILKLVNGSGDVKELFGVDSIEKCETMLLDAMELNTASTEYGNYTTYCKWAEAASLFLEENKLTVWKDIVEKTLKKYNSILGVDGLKEKISRIEESLPRTFDVIIAEYRWEFYKAVYEGEYLDFENLILEKWANVYEEMYSESIVVIEETDLSSMLHQLLSDDTAETIWEMLGYASDTAEVIIESSKQLEADISIFIAARATIDNCNLFLDTVYNGIKGSIGSDGAVVRRAAKAIKDVINGEGFLKRTFGKALEETFWKTAGKVKDKMLGEIGGSPGVLGTLAKVALQLTVAVGDNVFNVSDRHDIADNIRHLSLISVALVDGIQAEQAHYTSDKSSESANRCMQLISYLLKVREIGEQQVAALGMSGEVLIGAFDTAKMLYDVKMMSGAENVCSWVEWRDVVEDRISRLRVQLLKNPVTQQVGDICAPVVTFDYAAGQTAQKFSSEYEYSLNGGAWTPCNGGAIPVQTAYTATLEVRRIDRDSTNEKLTGLVTIYAPPSLSGSGIRVVQTAGGYRVEGLDNSRRYEVTFSNEAISYDYGDSLRTAIPAGSYIFDYAAKDSYDYVYIRSVADANRFASYVYRAPVYPMAELTVAVAAGHGVITGAGRYEYGSQAVLVATPNNDYEFAGWYDENGQLLGSETTLTLTLTGDRCISASFSRVKADWHEDPETGLATGFVEKLSVDEVTAYYAKLGRSASITGANGESVAVVATGCLLTLDDQTYAIVVSGDTNGDGSVSVLDVECLYTFLTQSRNEGSVTNEACFRSAVDFNSDGAVDVYDLQLLYETVSGIAKT